MKKLFFITFLIPFSEALAADSKASDCKSSTSATELVRCAIKSSTQVKLDSLNLDSQTRLVSKARNFRNPELGIESVRGDDGSNNLEAELLVELELFGQRSARINRAKAEKDIAEKQLLISKQDVAVQVVTTLYRLRQIDTETHLVTEAAETFTRVTKPYRGRLRLNPEQEVSLSVFELAAEENSLKIKSLEQERQKLLNQLNQLVGIETVAPALLPPLKTAWPEISNSVDAQSASLQLAASELKRAQAEVSAARADSWPTINVGPKFERSGDEETRVGVALSMPLPLFNVNSSGRAAARSQLTRAEIQAELMRKSFENEKALLLKTYSDSANTLKNSAQKAGLTKKHQSLHRLLNQGLVNASLVIELHRQMLDYQNTLHEQELRGVESYWRLLAIAGKLEEGEVK